MRAASAGSAVAAVWALLLFLMPADESGRVSGLCHGMNEEATDEDGLLSNLPTTSIAVNERSFLLTSPVYTVLLSPMHLCVTNRRSESAPAAAAAAGERGHVR